MATEAGFWAHALLEIYPTRLYLMLGAIFLTVLLVLGLHHRSLALP